MEYLLELRKGIFGRRIEKIIGITLMLMLMAGVVTSIWKREGVHVCEGLVNHSISERNKEMRTGLFKYSVMDVADQLLVLDVMDKIDTEHVGVEGTRAERSEASESAKTVKEESLSAETSPEAESADILEMTKTEVSEVPGLETELPDIGTTNTETEGPKTETIDKAEEILVTPKTEDTDISSENIISESIFMIDDVGMIYGFCPEYADLSKGYLELPTEGCMGIRRGTFEGCTEHIAEIHIASNITTIEDGALTELHSLEWIVTENENSSYLTKDGVLFDCTGTVLLAYPPARVGAYFIPEEVSFVSNNAFLNTSLAIIDVRGCGLSANCLLNISASCSIIE